ncbi:MAG: YlxR family protein [Candidatus Gastranaerophilales bacterium]|nr:YlxR family protein [Candidatus Gastranaerophilales bacterium]
MKEIKRKCQGCLSLIERNELIKITKLQNGKLKINPNSKELGRSVYVCPKEECIKNFIKKKKLKTALKFSNMEEISKIEEELKKFIQ